MLINADHYTAWNERKVLIQKGIVTREQELRLLDRETDDPLEIPCIASRRHITLVWMRHICVFGPLYLCVFPRLDRIEVICTSPPSRLQASHPPLTLLSLICPFPPLYRMRSKIAVVFSKHQKSQEAWAHRRWVAHPLLLPAECATTHEACDVEAACLREIRACERTAILYGKNYCSWTHRLWASNFMPSALLSKEVVPRHTRSPVYAYS